MTTEKSYKLQTALDYLDLNWSIIPLDKNLKPLIHWKNFTRRIATKEEVENWFKKWPEANIALVTGSISKVVVLETNENSNGNLMDLQYRITNENPSIETYYAYSDDGKMQMFFRHKGEDIVSRNILSHGINITIKGQGSYVVLPPSIDSLQNEYTWSYWFPGEHCDIWDIPEWFIREVFNK